MNKYIENLTRTVDESLVKGLDPHKGVLESAIHYALSVKGKRLRPLLFLALIEAYGKDPMTYMDIACAIECIHTYSLIHDDLPSMDNDDFRRGMPTVHKKFNDAIALLAGDTLLTIAFEKISMARAEPAKIVNIFRLLTVGIGIEGMAGGQVLDLEFKGDKNVILEIHRKKTAELIKATLLSAAEIVDLPPHEKELLAQAGTTIGVGFQMADDLLDIDGDEIEVGKKLHKDQGNHSPNAVLFYGKDFIKNEIDACYRKTITLLEELKIQFPPFLYLMEKMVYRSK
ncbi:MAG: polyprenyl synthetase family protein [Candidatus Aminicenantes bacterium]|nr:polyprenyl synthetase family protein [Candidatus Aminicenantes bacterium]